MLAAEHEVEGANRLLPQSGLKTIDRDLQEYFKFFNEMYALDLSLVTKQEKQQALMLIAIIENRLDGIRVGEHLAPINPVSYTHLPLPTIYSV